MLTSTAFRNAIRMTAERMEDGERQAARAAIKLGCKVLGCGRYYVGGPVVLRVEVPASWRHLESWQNAPWISVRIPADKEAATLAWAAKRMAN